MIRVLTIGNSFADNATQFLPDIAAADGAGDILVGRANLGGCSLEKHWNLVRQCELLPDVRPYSFLRTGQEDVPATLREALTAEAWDFVTLQQVSALSWRPESYEPYFGNLLSLVRELAPQAQPVIHQTWAYRADSRRFGNEDFCADQQTMHDGLIQAHQAMADKYDLPMLPSGHAFALARKELTFSRDPDYDYENPPLCELPKEVDSLIAGAFWRTGNTSDGNAQLGFDYIHCSPLGLYLSASVWFERLTGRLIAENPYCPEGVTDRQRAIAKTAAHQAAQEYGGPIAK